MKAFLKFSLLALLVTACSSAPTVADLPAQEDVRLFIGQMTQRHGFERPQLEAWLREARIRDDIIAAISRPAESKPWYQYRPIFLQSSRIEGGVTFWNDNAALLARAEEVYGVPPEIVTAILGVETRYGRYQGTYRVMDALATLAFGYPPRAAFFRGELEQFLLLAREEGMDPMAMTGSYAGAMGQTQFISSSYRHYAIDFDGDGKRDLWGNNADAIGSIANYFKEHGWVRGGTVALPATISGNRFRALVDKGPKPSTRLADMRKQGVNLETTLPEDTLTALIELEQKEGNEYWTGLQNFYVITRYNHSPLYAMAVYQLSREIRTLREQRLASAARQGR